MTYQRREWIPRTAQSALPALAGDEVALVEERIVCHLLAEPGWPLEVLVLLAKFDVRDHHTVHQPVMLIDDPIHALVPDMRPGLATVPRQ